MKGEYMKGLTINHYDCVEDIIEEALSTMCGIDSYCLGELGKDIEYITGCNCVVKLGEAPNTLKHQNHDGSWSDDVEISESYEYTTYYKKDVLVNIIEKYLTRKFYCNEFLEL
jgi:hypothetical protein